MHAQVSQNQWHTIDISTTYTFLSYHLLKALAWETFLEQPLTGIGRGNFEAVSTKAATEGHLVANSEGSHPHMTILGQFAESGLVGGIALLALWTGAFIMAHRLMNTKESSADIWIARASLAALAGLFVNGLYADIMNFRFLWIVLAFLRSLSLSSSKR